MTDARGNMDPTALGACPLRFDERSRMWQLTTHADADAALRDDRFSAALGQRQRARDDALPASMLTTDAGEHRRLRSPGSLLLGVSALRSVAPRIADDVKALMAELAAGPTGVDAAEAVGKRFATGVFARLFGMAAPAAEVFELLAEGAAVNLDPLAGPLRAAQGRMAMGELTRFLDGVADAARDCPLAALAADGRLARAEMLGILSLAVVGGWQPLAEMVGNALVRLVAVGGSGESTPDPAGTPRVDDPQGGVAPDAGSVSAAEALRSGGTEAALLVVDELLRLDAPIPFTVRVALGDVELPTGCVPSGGRVLIHLATANRDPAVFDRPDDLIPDRHPNPHLAFGAGPHFCLAAQLVRESGALLLPALLTSFPGLTLTATPQWDPRPIPRRLLSCPLDLRGADLADADLAGAR